MADPDDIKAYTRLADQRIATKLQDPGDDILRLIASTLPESVRMSVTFTRAVAPSRRTWTPGANGRPQALHHGR